MNSQTERSIPMPSESSVNAEQAPTQIQRRYAPPTLILLSDAARTANNGGTGSDGGASSS